MVWPISLGIPERMTRVGSPGSMGIDRIQKINRFHRLFLSRHSRLLSDPQYTWAMATWTFSINS